MTLRHLLQVSLALLVMCLTLIVEAPKSYAFTWLPRLCTSFSDCSSKGMGNAGYQNEYTVSHWGMYGGQNCTNYAAYRLIKNGIDASYLRGQGMGYQWGPVASQHGVAVDKSPRVGDIAWFQINNAAQMPYGHVGYVESVNTSNGTVRVSNDNDLGNFAWRDYRISDVSGFIHFGGVNREPIGSFDSFQTGPGIIRVRGWAFDPDKPASSIVIHAYVGGPAGSGEGHALGAASISRPDVAAAYPAAGQSHGFDFTFETSKRGSVAVYIYAIDTAGGNNPLIGSRSGSVSNPDPFGFLDSASSNSSGSVSVAGWAIDPNQQTSPVTIHVYIGGPAGSPNAEGHNIGTANVSRPDVGRVYPGTGSNHGYSKMITTNKRGAVAVYVYALNVSGTPGNNVELGHRNVYVTTPATTATDATSVPTYNVSKVKVSWSASSSATKGMAFAVQEREVAVGPTGKRSYGGARNWFASTSAKSAVFVGNPGHVYQFRSRVTDPAKRTGDWSSWQTATMPTDDRAASVSGVWIGGRSVSYYQGTYRSTKARNASFSYTAWTDKIEIVGTKSSTTGKVSVYIDGKLRSTIDTYSKQAKYRQILGTFSLRYGRHTVKVINQATSKRPNFIFDGLVVQ